MDKKKSKKTKEKTKRPPGQPTKYKPEFCQEIISFFDQEPYEDIDLPHYDKKGNIKWTDKKRMPKKLPTLVQFAKSINIGYSTVYTWQDKKSDTFHPDFLDALSRARELQKDILIQNGLQGLYNPIFAKFTAINITDMVDQIDTKHSGAINNYSDMSDEEIEARMRERSKKK